MQKIEILKLDHNGRGIGKLNEKTIFVTNALPGEVVTLKNIVDKKRYMEADVDEIIEKSNLRVKPICPYFYECGGCDLMHLKYDEQKKYKENKVKDIIKRFSDIDESVVKELKSFNELEYRNKVTFHVKETCGFYKKKSYEIVNMDKCFLISNKMNKIFNIVKKELPLEFISTFVIRESKRTNEVMLIFTLKNNFKLDDYLDNLKEKVTSIYTYFNGVYNCIFGKSYLHEQLQNFTFEVSPSAFFQVNTIVAEKMYLQALNYLNPSKEDNLLDLYCGTGTIGITISPYVSKVIGVEINSEAIKDANRNKDNNGVNNVTFYASKVSDIIDEVKGALVIVDPPRAGLDKKTISEIKKMKPKKLVYISCDPMTLVRDLKDLTTDFELVEITPFDMFPQTSHVECVCLLTIR